MFLINLRDSESWKLDDVLAPCFQESGKITLEVEGTTIQRLPALQMRQCRHDGDGW